MAVSRAKPDEIPKDAVVITQDEALAYQWKIISNWEDNGEVWALKYSPGILGAVSAVTGVFVNNHFRQKLRLGTYGKMSSYLPIVILPAMITALAHKLIVQRSVILEPLTHCPLCIQMRAASLQTGFGVVYPLLLAPLASFMFATRHFTYRLPSITEQPMEVLKLWRKMARPIVPLLGVTAAVHALGAVYLTYKEEDQNIRLHFKLREIERQVELEKTL